jgi:hypothetical protein
MKKKFSILILLIVFSFSIILTLNACKKDCTTTISYVTAKHTIEGLWVGTYTVYGDATNSKHYFSYVIKPNATMINDTEGGGQQHLAIGTWSLTGTNLKCDFTCVYGILNNIGVRELGDAIWDSANNKLIGTWENVSPLLGKGNVELTKVQ